MIHKSPFKFLDSYTKDDREIFFGREREIEELYHRVFESKIMLVYGVSGTGKSSLINCGLANKFNETDWLPLNIRRGGNILDSLAASIKAASITQQTGEMISPSHFKKAVRSLYLDHYKPVFFIFDQFEELFIFGNKEEKKAFIQVIKTLVESDIQCRFIFVMREEYMASVTEFERYIPYFFANRVRIEKMSHQNALEAIKGPCRIVNINVEEGFAEALLEKLSPESTDVELTYLQVFLDKIFRLATTTFPPPGGESKGGSLDGESQGGAFTIPLLSRVGNISDLLGSFLDEQLALMENPDSAMTVLKTFVSGKGTKRPASETETIENVRSLGKEISPDIITELIQSFIRLRVLRDKDDNGRYELRHDTLAEKIFEKFSTAEKELLETRQYIENAYQAYLKRKTLLSNDDLEYISNKDTFLNLNNEIKTFLEESRNLKRARIKTVRRLTIVSALVFILVLAILGYYINKRFSLEESNYRAFLSIDQSPHPVRSLDWAITAWEKHSGIFAKEALIKSFNRILHYPDRNSKMIKITAPVEISFEPAPVQIQYAGSSRDSKYIFGYGDSLILRWNNKGKLEKIIKTEHSPIIDMKFSADGSYIGVISHDSLLYVWYVDGNKKFSHNIFYNKLNTNQIFKFTKEDNIIAITKEHGAVLFNLDGKILQEFDKHNAGTNAVDVTDDDKFIAIASSDKTINIWYYNTIEKRYDLYNKVDWHKDTVWSASFSSQNYNIISASADSQIMVGNINKELQLTVKGKNPYCYAKFTPGDRGFSTIDYIKNGDNITYTFYGIDSRNPDAYSVIRNKFSIPLKQESGPLEQGLPGFSYLGFSSKDNYLICGTKNEYFLVDNRQLFEYGRLHDFTLLQLEGIKPFFMEDEKNLITIMGKNLRQYFIDAPEIYRITNPSGK